MYVLCDSHLKSLVRPKNTCPQKVFHGDRCCLQGARPTYNPFLGQWPFVGCKDKLLHLPHLQYHGNSNWWFSWGHRHPIWYISIIFRDHMAALKKKVAAVPTCAFAGFVDVPFWFLTFIIWWYRNRKEMGVAGPSQVLKTMWKLNLQFWRRPWKMFMGECLNWQYSMLPCVKPNSKPTTIIYYIFYIIIYIIYRSILYII